MWSGSLTAQSGNDYIASNKKEKPFTNSTKEKIICKEMKELSTLRLITKPITSKDKTYPPRTHLPFLIDVTVTERGNSLSRSERASL